MTLEGKIAVVSGGGRGIGKEIALRLAAEGADVALAARSADQIEEVAALIEKEGRRALPVVTDLREPDQITALAETVATELGPTDILVNNSGIAGAMGNMWEIDLDGWQETIGVNLTGVFLCCKAFLPEMIDRRSGSVVIIGSATGKRPLKGRTPYAASKLALVGLVRTLAWELGEYDVRANLISPGFVDGERLQRVVEGQSEAKGQTLEETRAEMTASSPLLRFVDPKNVAAAVTFLASDDAASITGEDFNVTSGLVMF